MNESARQNGRRMIYLGSDEARFVILALVLVLLGLSHRSPQGVAPLQGISIAAGIVVLTAVLAALRLSARQAGGGTLEIGRRSFTAIVAYFVFLLWAWKSSVTALVPAFAREYLATYLEGFWVLVAAYLALLGTAPREESEECAEPCLHRQGAARETRARAHLLWLVALFFVVVAVLSSIDALNQYLWKFKQQLAELDRKGLYLGSDRLSDGVRHALRERRVVASFGNPNIFCGFLAFSLPFVVAGLLLVKKRIAKCGFLVALVLVLIAAYLTRSRAGMLSIVIAAVLTIALIRREWLLRARHALAVVIVIVAVGVIIFAAVSLVGPPALKETLDKSGLVKRLTNVSTFQERLFYVRSGIWMIGRAPVGGNGLGAYSVLYPQYRILEARESQYAHNVIVQMLVEMGVIGLALFAAFIVLVARSLKGALSPFRTDAFEIPPPTPSPQSPIPDELHPRRSATALSGLELAALVSFIVFLMNSLMEYTFYFREFYLDFCLLAGVLLAVRGERSEMATAHLPIPACAGKPNPQPPADEVRPAPVSRCPRYVCVVVLWALSLALGPAYIVKPFLASFYSYYGDDAVTQGEAKTALAQYEHAVALQPDNPWLVHKVARTLFTLGKHDDALATMRRAIALNPYSAYLHDELATLYQQQGLLTQAMGEAQKAIQKYPYNARYHYHLAQLALQSGDKTTALREAKLAVELEQGGIFQGEYDALLDTLRRLSE